MGEPAPRHFDLDRVRCIHCGVEQDAPQAAEAGRCARCNGSLDAPERADSPPRDVVELASPMPRLRASEQALAELVSVGLTSESPKMVDELVAVEKRGDTLLAFVPFVGPWLILRSGRHTREERWRLSVLSIGLTVVVLAVIWSLMPSEADRLASLRQRIRSEMGVLGDIADQYRADQGAYPGVATWKRFAERADGRFFDPWGRPYRYEPRGDGVMLGTLGRDGLEGGTDKDADVTVDRQPPPRLPLRGRPLLSRLYSTSASKAPKARNVLISTYLSHEPPLERTGRVC